MTKSFHLTDKTDDIDWHELAALTARAPLVERAPDELERAWRNSFACVTARQGQKLIAAARALSDGVYYATIYDVVVDPDWQGKGVGRAIIEDLLARLPVEKVFLTSVPGKQRFYEKLGFLRQTNAMGHYAKGLREEAIEYGVLLSAEDLESPRVLAISDKSAA